MGPSERSVIIAGAGLQSTAWLYVLWHTGFVLFVIVYALLQDLDPIRGLSEGGVRAAVLASVGSVAALVFGATVLRYALNDLRLGSPFQGLSNA
jgi:hypothetical protein